MKILQKSLKDLKKEKKFSGRHQQSGVIAILVALLVFTGTAFAWFVAQSVTEIQAETAQMGVDYTLTFDADALDQIVPGGTLTSVTHSIENTGNLPAIVQLTYGVTFEDQTLDTPDDLISITWAEQYTRIGDAYYIKLAANERIDTLDAIQIHFNGEVMNSAFMDKKLKITATATGVQTLEDAVAGAFGSEETANTLEELGFFTEDKQPKNVRISNYLDSTGLATFSLDANEAWVNAINKVVAKYSDGTEKTCTVFLVANSKTATGFQLAGRYVQKASASFYGEYTTAVVFSAEGYEDVIVDVTSVTK